MALDSSIGGAGAESYASVAQADSYHSLRGNASWTSLSEAKKEAALRQAAQYIDTMYNFKGVKNTAAQALLWPRYGIELEGCVIGTDTLPARLLSACCELALKASVASLMPDISPQVVTSEAVGPLSVSYSENQRAGGRKQFDLVDALLEPFTNGRGQIPVSRA